MRDADHGDAADGNDSCGVAFEIASQTAIATDPGERSFDNPTLGQHLERNGNRIASQFLTSRPPAVTQRHP
jgi:hypothetical protein